MISFIIPCYNSADKITICLNSIIKQNINDSEIIIVNDGSTDNTLEVIKEYILKHSEHNIRLFTKKNGGVASARNDGLDKATKDYIQFIDADDNLSDDYFKVLNNYLIEKKYDIIYYDFNIKFSDTNLEYYKNFNRFATNERDNYIIQSFSPWMFVVKRNYLRMTNFKFLEDIIYEDYASIAYLGKNTYKIKYVDKALYSYSKIGESITRIKSKKFQKKYLDIIPATENLLPLLKTDVKDEILYLITQHLLIYGIERIDKCEDSYKIKSDAKRKIIAFYHKHVKGFVRTKYFRELQVNKKLVFFIYYLNLTGALSFYTKIKKLLRG